MNMRPPSSDDFDLGDDFKLSQYAEMNTVSDMDQYIVSSDDDDCFMTHSNSLSSMSSMESSLGGIKDPLELSTITLDYFCNYTFLSEKSESSQHFKNKVPRDSPFTFASADTSLNPLLIFDKAEAQSAPQRLSSLDIDPIQILPDENDLFHISYTSEPEEDSVLEKGAEIGLKSPFQEKYPERIDLKSFSFGLTPPTTALIKPEKQFPQPPFTPPHSISNLLVRYQRTLLPNSPGKYFLVQFQFRKRLQFLQKVSTPFQFGVRTPDSLRLPPAFTAEFYSLRETRYFSLDSCKALGNYALPSGMTNNFPNRLGIISPYLDAHCTETSIVSAQPKRPIDNDRYYSRLNIYELSKLLHLDKWSIELTREVEGNILEIFSFYCGFELGYKTWIRDTKKSTRTVLLQQLHSLTLVFYPEICIQTLGVIIRRGTYSIMQSRLRKERRSKRASK